jgi:hypothetical protein
MRDLVSSDELSDILHCALLTNPGGSDSISSFHPRFSNNPVDFYHFINEAGFLHC